MFKKILLAAAAFSVLAGSLGATTTSASAHGRRYIQNYDWVYVCKPVFDWKWVYSHYDWKLVKVKVGESCDWVKVAAHHDHHRYIRTY